MSTGGRGTRLENFDVNLVDWLMEKFEALGIDVDPLADRGLQPGLPDERMSPLFDPLRSVDVAHSILDWERAARLTQVRRQRLVSSFPAAAPGLRRQHPISRATAAVGEETSEPEELGTSML